MNIKEMTPKSAFILAFIVWLMIGIIFYFFTKEISSVYGIILAFIITVFLMLKNYLSQWSGEISDIKTETVTNTDSDGNVDSKQVTYAYIKLDGGRRKKILLNPAWKIGDRLKKVKWESSVKKEIDQ